MDDAVTIPKDKLKIIANVLQSACVKLSKAGIECEIEDAILQELRKMLGSDGNV